MTSSLRPAGTARTLLLTVAAVVFVEALGLIALGAIGIFDQSPDGAHVGLGTGVFLAVYGVAQAWAAWRVVQGDSWARSPLVVTHLIQLVIAANMDDVPTWITALLVVAALVVVASLLAPPVTRALSDGEPV